MRCLVDDCEYTVDALKLLREVEVMQLNKNFTVFIIVFPFLLFVYKQNLHKVYF